MVNTWDVVHMVKAWSAGHGSNTWAPRLAGKDAASVDLGDQYWPTGTKVVPHIFIWPSGHDGTIR